MPRLKLELDQETFARLAEDAIAERRPFALHAEVLLRRALGLTFPYPVINVTVGAVDAKQ